MSPQSPDQSPAPNDLQGTNDESGVWVYGRSGGGSFAYPPKPAPSLSRDEALDAIDALVDRQTAIGITAARVDASLATSIHETCQAWRALAQQLAGITLDPLDQLNRHLSRDENG